MCDVRFDAYFSFSKSKKGYSGVVTYVRQRETNQSRPGIPVLAAEEGVTGILLHSKSKKTNSTEGTIGGLDGLDEFDPCTKKELDSEGRCVVTDHGSFVLFNVYFPNAALDSPRMEFKLKSVNIKGRRMNKNLMSLIGGHKRLNL